MAAALPRPQAAVAAAAAAPAGDRTLLLDRIGDRARMLDPLLHNTVSPTVLQLRRQVQRDPRRGGGGARRPAAAGLRARRPARRAAGAARRRRRARGRALRPGPGRARHVAVPHAGRHPRARRPGQHRDPAADAGGVRRALLRAARHPDLRLPADEAARRASTSGRACTAPTSASPPTRSTSARTPCTRRWRASGRPPERRARHALGADACPSTPSRCASTARCSRAPRRSASPTCGAARPRARTASRRWRWPRPGPSACASAPAS